MAEDEESEFRAAMKRIEHSEGCRAAASLFDQLKVGKGAVPDFTGSGSPKLAARNQLREVFPDRAGAHM
jgi:hypothetical protein